MPLLLAGCTVTGPPITPAQVGQVTITQDTVEQRGELDVYFRTDSCVRRSIGPCNLVDCSGNDGGAIMPANSGPVSVSGLAGLTASVSPGPDGTYPPSQLSGRLWTGSTALGVFSGGGTVPKFNETIKTPVKDLIMLSPFGGAITIDSARDYNVSWGTPIDDSVQMTIDMDAGATLTCTWGGSDLMDAIPTLALDLLPRGATSTGHWRIDSVQTTTTTDPPWVLTLQAAQTGHDTQSVSTTGLLTLD